MKAPVIEESMAQELNDIFEKWAIDNGFSAMSFKHGVTIAIFDERIGSMTTEGRKFTFKFDGVCLRGNVVSGDIYDSFAMGVLMGYFDQMEEMLGGEKILVMDICEFLNEKHFTTRVKSSHLFQVDTVIRIDVQWNKHPIDSLSMTPNGAFRAEHKVSESTGVIGDYGALYHAESDILLVEEMNSDTKKEIYNFFTARVWDALRGNPVGKKIEPKTITCDHCYSEVEIDE